MCSATINESDGDQSFDQLNFSGIAFPSDRITVRDLRRAYPEAFDHGLRRNDALQPRYFHHSTFAAPDPALPSAADLGAILFSERLIAAFAYAAARGIPEPSGWEGEHGLADYKRDLSDFYTSFGIATGEHHSGEMIREIERQARQLVPDLPR